MGYVIVCGYGECVDVVNTVYTVVSTRNTDVTLILIEIRWEVSLKVAPLGWETTPRLNVID